MSIELRKELHAGQYRDTEVLEKIGNEIEEKTGGKIKVDHSDSVTKEIIFSLSENESITSVDIYPVINGVLQNFVEDYKPQNADAQKEKEKIQCGKAQLGYNLLLDLGQVRLLL